MHKSYHEKVEVLESSDKTSIAGVWWGVAVLQQNPNAYFTHERSDPRRASSSPTEQVPYRTGKEQGLSEGGGFERLEGAWRDIIHGRMASPHRKEGKSKDANYTLEGYKPCRTAAKLPRPMFDERSPWETEKNVSWILSSPINDRD
jgi:hypothetical protein